MDAMNLTTGVSALALGVAHSMALASGTVYTWGQNSNGQLGDVNRASPSLLPAAVVWGRSGYFPEPGGVLQIAAQGSTSACLGADLQVYVWGINNYGQVGDGLTAIRPNPYRTVWSSSPFPATGLSAISVGLNQVCAVGNGTVYCWGYNGNGELGVGDTTNRPFPVASTWTTTAVPPGTPPQPNGVVKLSNGNYHTMVIGADGYLYGWGLNNYGQVGNPYAGSYTTPIAVSFNYPASPSGPFVDVASGQYHTIALGSDGRLYTWGYNNAGQLGDQTTTNRARPVYALVQGSVLSIGMAGGVHSTCVVTFPSPSPGLVSPSVSPTTVPAGNPVNAYLWGYNGQGQLGRGSASTSAFSTPQLVQWTTQIPAPNGGLTDIATGCYNTLAVGADDVLYAWGDNGYGQIGDGTLTGRVNPVPVKWNTTLGAARKPNGFFSIAVGQQYMMALGSDRAVYSWGYNGYGNVGDGTTTNRNMPVAVQWLANAMPVGGVLQISTFFLTSYCLGADYNVYSWGYNANSQIGDGGSENRYVPYAVQYTGSITQVAAGSMHACFIDGGARNVLCVGNNGNGQLGDGTGTARALPVAVQWSEYPPVPTGGVIQVACGGFHTVALGADKYVYSWGYDAYGQLGWGLSTQSLVPVQVYFAPNSRPVGGFVQVAASSLSSMALGADHTLYAWGYNGYGIVGDGSTTNRPAPVPVVGFPGQVNHLAPQGGNNAVSGYSNAAVLLGGNPSPSLTPMAPSASPAPAQFVWSAGYNNYGQLGALSSADTAAHNSYMPLLWTGKVSTPPAGIIAAASGYQGSILLSADKQLYTFGDNTFGQCGDGTFTMRVFPVAVQFNLAPAPALGFTAVAAGSGHMMALGADKQVYTWGDNTDGQLGDGTYYQRRFPVLVQWGGGGAAYPVGGVTGISTSASTSMAVGGSPSRVYAWGYNVNYQVGDGTTSDRLQPFATLFASAGVTFASIGNVTSVSTGNVHSCLVTGLRTVLCWGTNSNGQLGDTTSTNQNFPVNVVWGNPLSAGVVAPVVEYPGIYGGVVSVKVGGFHSVALDGKGNLYCWGLNNYGQCGSAWSAGSYVYPQGISWKAPSAPQVGVTQIAAGLYSTTALGADYRVYTFGYNGYGQLADETVTSRNYPVYSFFPANVAMLGDQGSRSQHVFIITQYAPQPANVTSPSPTKSPTTATAPTIFLWGQNNYDQLGLPAADSSAHTTPAELQFNPVRGADTPPGGILMASMSAYNTAVLGVDRNVYVWGDNTYGQCGDGTNKARLSPVSVVWGVSGFAALPRGGVNMVAVGQQFCLALGMDKNVYSWGYNGNGQLGDGTTNNRFNPIPVSWESVRAPSGGFTWVATNYQTSYALGADFGIYAWGYNYYFMIADGTGSTENRFFPVASSFGKVVQAVAAGQNHACLLQKQSNNVYCWGYNYYGQVGDGTTTTRPTPVPVEWQLAPFAPTGGVIQITCGTQHSVALGGDGHVYSWGYDGQGALGDGGAGQQNNPVKMFWNGGAAWPAPGVTEIQATGPGTMMLGPDGTVYATGYNGYGQLGDSTTTNRNMPVMVLGLSSPVSSLCRFGGNSNSNGAGVIIGGPPNTNVAPLATAPTTGGVVYTFGSNINGELGQFGFTDGSAHPQAGSIVWNGAPSMPGGGISQVVTSVKNTYMLGVDANVYSLGDNSYGQCGDGTYIDRLLPTAVVWSFKRPMPVGGIIAIAAGNEHVLALGVDYNVYVWGSNQYGQLGDQSVIQRPNPVPMVWGSPGAVLPVLAGNRGLRMLAAGGDSTIVLGVDKKVYAWGYNGNGQLGDGTTVNRNYPLAVLWASAGVSFLATGSGIIYIASGQSHTCAIGLNNKAFCWGYNNYGQLGDGTGTQRLNPVFVTWNGGTYALAPSGGVTQISCGDVNTVALGGDGYVYAWGYNGNGQVGVGTGTTNYVYPMSVTWNYPLMPSGGITAVAAYGQTVLALGSDSNVYSWGYNGYGQVADLTSTGRNSPVQALISVPVQSLAISSSANHAGVVAAAASPSPSPNVQASCPSPSEIPMGYAGVVHTYGMNTRGQLAQGGTADSAAHAGPVPIIWTTPAEPVGGVLQVAVGQENMIALGADNNVYTWGDNSYGQLGIGTSTGYAINPKSVVWTAGFANFPLCGLRAVSCGQDYMMALGADQQIYTWGYNAYGNLGDGTTSNRPFPVRVRWIASAHPGTIAEMTTAYYTSYALGGNGIMYGWGYNYYSQVGDRGTANRLNPISMNWAGGVNQVAAGQSHFCIIDSASKNNVFCVGYNYYGQLGDGTTNNRAYPVQVQWNNAPYFPPGGLVQIACGAIHTVALGAENNVYAWGYNGYGQLGDGSTVQNTLPTKVVFNQVGAALPVGGIKQIGAFYYTSVALGNDYTVYSWGQNNYGQLGDNNPGSTANPNPVLSGAAFLGTVTGLGSLNGLSQSGAFIVTGIPVTNNAVAPVNPPLDQTVVTFGCNTNGELGTLSSTDGNSHNPQAVVWTGQPAKPPAFKTVSTGNANSAVVGSDGNVYTWGLNNLGQCGDGTFVQRYNPVQVIFSSSFGASFPSGGVVKVCVGTTHMIALGADTEVYTWGDNSVGQLGDGTLNAHAYPQAVVWDIDPGAPHPPGGILDISAFNQHNLVLGADLAAYAWGYDYYSQLGDNAGTNKVYPQAVLWQTSGVSLVNINNVAAVSAGYQHSCAIGGNTRVYCWGGNTYGGVGDGTSTQRGYPVAVQWTGQYASFPATGIKQVVAGTWFTAALGNDGFVYTWGYNGAYALGFGTAQQNNPVMVSFVYPPSPVGNIVEIAVGYYTVLALGADTKAYAWGQNNYGQLGDNTVTNRNTPVSVLVGAGVKTVGLSSFGYHSVIVMEVPTPSPTRMSASPSQSKIPAPSNFAKLYLTGTNQYGQLGVGTTDGSAHSTAVAVAWGSAPYAPQPPGGVKIAVVGDNNIAVIGFNNEVYTWGYNNNGQCGDGTVVTPRSRPIAVVWSYPGYAARPRGGVTAVAVGGSHMLALGGDKMVYSWGNNANGQLGDGTVIRKVYPIAVTWTGVTMPLGIDFISTSQDTSYALGTDGTLYSWGYNYYGQIGDKTTENRLVPFPLNWQGNVTYVAAGWFHTCLIDSAVGNEVFCWGYNYYGAVGDSTTTQRNYPVAVQWGTAPALPAGGIIQIAGGYYHTVALGADKAVYSWGYNGYGQLGDSTTNNALVPTKVFFNSVASPVGGVVQVGAGLYHSVALGADKKLYTWGYNNLGELGDATTTTRLSPVVIQVSGLTPVLALAQTNTASEQTACILGGSPNVGRTVAPAYYPTNNTIFAYGINSNGQLGTVSSADGAAHSLPESIVWTAMPTVPKVIDQIVAGDANSMILGKGLVYTWGDNTNGQCGDGTYLDRYYPTLVVWGTVYGAAFPVGGVQSIALGYRHMLALGADNQIYSWGLNADGQLGDSTLVSRAYPVMVNWISGAGATYPGSFIDVSAFYATSMALSGTYNVYCWGLNNNNQVGDGTTVSKNVPYDVRWFGGVTWASTGGIYEFQAGYYHNCLLGINNKVYCFGYNGQGQLGDGTTTNRLYPIAMLWLGAAVQEPPGGVVQVAPGYYHTCMLGADSNGYCVGYNYYGECGVSSATTQYNYPVQVTFVYPPLPTGGLVSISSGTHRSMALGADQRVYAWGYNAYGQLGDQSTVTRDQPVVSLVPTLVGLISKSSYGYHVKVLGGIPPVVPVPAASPTASPAPSGVPVSKLYLWGQNNNGQLAYGSTVNSMTPVTVIWTVPAVPVGGIKAASIGETNGLAIGGDRQLYSWGANTVGQCGDGTATQRLNPVLVVWNNAFYPQGGFNGICVGQSHMMALGVDNKVYTWGGNAQGQLGDGSTSNRYFPVSVSWLETGEPAGGVTQIATALMSSFALGANGRLYGWGNNDNNQLGDPTTTARSYPRLLQWAGGVNQVSTGAYHTCIIDGSWSNNVFCFGWNAYGQLGDSTTTQRAYPVLVEWDTTPPLPQGGVIQISCGYQHTLALGADKWMYAWGDDSYGQLGDGQPGGNFAFYQPVKVVFPSAPANGIVQVAANRVTSVALSGAGVVYTFGYNVNGQIGDGTTVNKLNPIIVGGLGVTTSLAYGATGQTTAVIIGGPAVSGVLAPATLTQSTVYAMGTNIYGELGVQSSKDSASHTQPMSVIWTGSPAMPAGGVLKVVSGLRNTIVLGNDRQVYTWGDNSKGQIGDGTQQLRYYPVKVVWGFSYGAVFPSGGITDIATGSLHMMVLGADAHVYSWGYNANGQIGVGSTIDYMYPVRAIWGTGGVNANYPPGGIIAISAYYYTSYCIGGNGAVYSWGYNSNGQIGDGQTVQRPLPVAVAFTDASVLQAGLIDIAAGLQHVCTVEWTNDVLCWGYNGYGQLGDGTTTDRVYPVFVLWSSATAVQGRAAFPIGGILKVVSGDYHVLALGGDQNIYGWGYNGNNQLGLPSTASISTPMQLTWSGAARPVGGVKAITTFSTHSMCLGNDGRLYAWGYNNYGQLGDETVTTRAYPVRVQMINNALTLSKPAQGQHSAVIAALLSPSPSPLTPSMSGSPLPTQGAVTKIYAFGNNNYGQLSRGTTGGSSGTPQVIVWTAAVPMPPAGIISVAMGINNGLCIATDRNLYAWGYNNYGQVGDGTTTTRANPVQVVWNYPGYASYPLGGFTSIAVGDQHMLVLGADTKVYGWGYNGNGQIGDGTTHSRIFPVMTLFNDDAFPAGGIVQISAHQSQSFALGGNMVFAWGYNYYNDLGDGTTNNRMYPHKVPFAGIFVAVQSGENFACAIGGDTIPAGSVFCWGYNYYQMLGDGTATQRAYPVAVQWLSSTQPAGGVTDLACGEYHTLVIGADLSVYAWGYNGYGQIGDGTTTQRPYPTKVSLPVLPAGYFQVAAGAHHSVSLGSDYNVYTWGYDNNGQCGDGLTANRLLPYKLLTPGTSTSIGIMSNTGTNTVLLSGAAPSASRAPVAPSSSAAPASIPYAWGYNSNGQLGVVGYADGAAHSIPSRIQWSGTPSQPSGGVLSMSSGLAHSLILGADKMVYSVGDNTYGQLGDGTLWDRQWPVWVVWGNVQGAPAPGGGFTAVGAGDTHSLALGADKQVYSWGSNLYGQIGDRTIFDRRYPVRVPWGGVGYPNYPPGGVLMISASYRQSMALGGDAQVYTWGFNNYNMLGDNTVVNRIAPVYVVWTAVTFASTGGLVSIAMGQQHACALGVTGNNNAYCWGYNYYGQLGDNTGTQRATPVRVVWATPVAPTGGCVQIAVGILHTVALGADQMVYTWGYNGNGNLGSNGSPASTALPITPSWPVGTNSTTLMVVTNQQSSCSLSVDSNIYCWGYNPYGNVGDGTAASKSRPTRVLLPGPAVGLMSSGGSSFTALGLLSFTSLSPSPSQMSRTPSSSITPTGSLTISNSATISLSFIPGLSKTPSTTASETATGSITMSRSTTGTGSLSFTSSISMSMSTSSTNSMSQGASQSSSITATASQGQTPTASVTSGLTPTASITPSVTSGLTPTASVTTGLTPTAAPGSSTATVSITATASQGQTPTASVTSGLTPTMSITPSATSGQTATASVTTGLTPTASWTPSASSGQTPTASVTTGLTPTMTPSATVSGTPSVTPSASSGQTATASVTSGLTPTASWTPSASSGQTVTASVTSGLMPTTSNSPSASSGQTATASVTSGLMPTNSWTPSASSGQTITASVTSGLTPTASWTPSASSGQTWTASVTSGLTPTASITASASSGQTATASVTSGLTPTGSWTPSASSGQTATASVTTGLTPTASVTGSITPTASTGLTSTATQSVSESVTASQFQTHTASATSGITPTASVTAGLTPTQSPSLTPSASSGQTPTASVTSGLTPTASWTPSASSGQTATASVTSGLTPTMTPSASDSGTSSVSPSASQDQTPTASVTSGLTPTASWTPSASSGQTVTASVTSGLTPTRSVTPSMTASVTFSPTNSVTSGLTPTASVTSGLTPTASVTSGLTPTASETPSVTATVTASTTPTVSTSAGQTATASVTTGLTPTATPSVTTGLTPTASPMSASRTVTSGLTPSATVTSGLTPTASQTPSATINLTPTASETPEPSSSPVSVTPSQSGTVGFSATRSPTPGLTPSASVTTGLTPTASDTPSATTNLTPTASMSAEPSLSPVSITPSQSGTVGFSATRSPTSGLTPSASVTTGLTATASDTPSATTNLTPTASMSAEPSLSPVSATPSQSGTVGFSATRSPTSGLTPSASVTSGLTATSSTTPSASTNQTPTSSITPDAVVTLTATASMTGSRSATSAASITGSTSVSATVSVTSGLTATSTPTISDTSSITPTISDTASITPTISETSSISLTISVSKTISLSGSSTNTASATRSESASASAGQTPTASATNGLTATASVTSGLTATASITGTASVSMTGSVSVTPGLTSTASTSLSGSNTPSTSPVSVTPTPQSVTPSNSPLSLTNTASPSATQTPMSMSITPTPSASPGQTPTASPTISDSSSASSTNSATPSRTSSTTPSISVTPVSATRTAVSISNTPVSSPTVYIDLYLANAPINTAGTLNPGGKIKYRLHTGSDDTGGPMEDFVVLVTPTSNVRLLRSVYLYIGRTPPEPGAADLTADNPNSANKLTVTANAIEYITVYAPPDQVGSTPFTLAVTRPTSPPPPPDAILAPSFDQNVSKWPFWFWIIVGALSCCVLWGVLLVVWCYRKKQRRREEIKEAEELDLKEMAATGGALGGASVVHSRPQVAVAIAKYQATSDDELSLTPGEQVTVIEEYDDGWGRGRTADGRTGIFPMNFVSSPKKNETSDPEADDEGDDGTMPAKPGAPGLPARTRAPSAFKSDRSGAQMVAYAANSLATVDNFDDHHGAAAAFPDPLAALLGGATAVPAAPRGPEAGLVIKEFRPNNDDEIPLTPGENVLILERFEDGWCRGTANGRHGVFPFNHVQVTGPAPPEAVAAAPAAPATIESASAVSPPGPAPAPGAAAPASGDDLQRMLHMGGNLGAIHTNANGDMVFGLQ